MSCIILGLLILKIRNKFYGIIVGIFIVLKYLC